MNRVGPLDSLLFPPVVYAPQSKFEFNVHKHQVYILRLKKGRFYVGVAKDMKRSILQQTKQDVRMLDVEQSGLDCIVGLSHAIESHCSSWDENLLLADAKKLERLVAAQLVLLVALHRVEGASWSEKSSANMSNDRISRNLNTDSNIMGLLSNSATRFVLDSTTCTNI